MWFGVLAPAAARGGAVFPPNKSPNDLSMIRPKNLRPKNSPGGASGCRARASGCWHATRAKKTIGHQTSLLQSLRLNTIVKVVIIFKVVTVMSVMRLHARNRSPVLNCYGEEKIIIIFKVVTVMSVRRLHARNKS